MSYYVFIDWSNSRDWCCHVRTLMKNYYINAMHQNADFFPRKDLIYLTQPFLIIVLNVLLITVVFVLFLTGATHLVCQDGLRTRELSQSPRTMLSTYAILMHPYCPDRESNPGLPRGKRGLWHCTTCLAFAWLSIGAFGRPIVTFDADSRNLI